MGGGAALFELVDHSVLPGHQQLVTAIWTSYGEARTANPGAYASAQAFAGNDAVTHAHALAGIPVRVASGDDDPFHSGVEALARELPADAVVRFSKGCHTDSFFTTQEPASLSFLARHLSV